MIRCQEATERLQKKDLCAKNQAQAGSERRLQLRADSRLAPLCLLRSRMNEVLAQIENNKARPRPRPEFREAASGRPVAARRAVPRPGGSTSRCERPLPYLARAWAWAWAWAARQPRRTASLSSQRPSFLFPKWKSELESLLISLGRDESTHKVRKAAQGTLEDGA